MLVAGCGGNADSPTVAERTPDDSALTAQASNAVLHALREVASETSPDTAVTRHEGGAACAADGYARLTGRPGVCLATAGPGATNLLTGVGGALRDSSPMIVLTCNNLRKDIGFRSSDKTTR